MKTRFLITSLFFLLSLVGSSAFGQVRVAPRRDIRAGAPVYPVREVESPAPAPAVEVFRYDLGPEYVSNYATSNGYPWSARGYIYPYGTFTARPGNQPPRFACAPPNDVQPVGSYLIRGRTGGPADHVADYALNFTSIRPVLQYFFSGQVIYGLDQGGFPVSLSVEGTAPSQPDRRMVIEFTPRSSQCFGGSVTISILP